MSFTRFLSTPVLRRSLGPGLYLLAALCFLVGAVISDDPEPQREVVLVIDDSGSVTADGSKSLPPFVTQLAEESDRVAFIRFAGDASVVEQGGEQADGRPRLERHASHYAAALRLAAGLPRATRSRRRVVLLGDGRATVGGALEAAGALAANAVLDTVAFGGVPKNDAGVRSIRVGPGSETTARVVDVEAWSSRPAAVDLTLERIGSDRVERRNVKLDPAGQTVRFEMIDLSAGLNRFRARVRLSGDPIPENDQAEAACLIPPENDTLWVGGDAPSGVTAASSAQLTRALIQSHRAVVLDSVSLSSLPDGIDAALRMRVREGGGLLVIASPTSVSDARSGDALRSLMPVRLAPKDGLAVAVAVDVSGSMATEITAPGGERTTKLSVAAGAVLEVMRRLEAGDQVGVIVFAGDARTVHPLAYLGEDRVADVERVRERLGDESAGGGTSVFAGARVALDALANTRAHVRAAILVTDGDTQETGDAREEALAELAERLEESGVRLAVIALGADPDAALLDALKTRARAEVVRPDRLLDLPSILWRQVAASRNPLRGPASLGAIKAHSIVRGVKLNPDSTINRFVAVGAPYRDRGAESILETIRGETLLATWRVGLGQVAFLAGHPARDWGWQTSGKALTQAAADWCGQGWGDARMGGRVENDRLILELDDPAAREAETISSRDVGMTQIDESGDHGEVSIRLDPVAPGLWRGESVAPAKGVYRLASDVTRGVVVVEDREEWVAFGADGRALSALAHAGGGRFVHAHEQFTPWERIPVAGEAESRIAGRIFLMAGAFLLLAGLAWAAWR